MIIKEYKDLIYPIIGLLNADKQSIKVSDTNEFQVKFYTYSIDEYITIDKENIYTTEDEDLAPINSDDLATLSNGQLKAEIRYSIIDDRFDDGYYNNILTQNTNFFLQIGNSGGGTVGDTYTREQIDNKLEDKVDVTAYTSDKQEFALKSQIPTNVSQLTNDSGYLTSIPSEYITESELLEKNYATKDEIPEEYTLPVATSEILGGVKVGAGLTVGEDGLLSATGGGVADSVEWENVQNKPTFSTVATSGSYNDLADKPSIPTTVSQLTNDANYVTNSELTAGLQGKQDLLESGTNIKTINGNSLLGEGDITIEVSGGTDLSNYYNKQEVDGKLTDKVDVTAYTTDKQGFETKENASATYQVKGDYALKSELPTDYVTDAELANYATTTTVNGIDTRLLSVETELIGTTELSNNILLMI